MWEALITAISAAVVSRAGEDAGKAAQSTWTALFRLIKRRLGPRAAVLEAGDRRALERELWSAAPEDQAFLARLQSLLRQAREQAGEEPWRELVVPSPALPGRTPARQLPPAPADFVNRVAELSALDEIGGGAAGATPVVVLRGPPGVGKHSLALRWGHKRQERFDGGQFYADLSESADGVLDGPGLTDDALTSFLVAMGVPSAVVPATFAARQALFRTLAADRPVLVVLHGPALPAQIGPLVPTAAGSVVLVCTQHDVRGLAMEGARFIDVAPLAEEAALELLAAGCGDDRITGDPAAAKRLVGLCGGLAVAIRVVAGRLLLDPTMTVAELADEVAAEPYPLAALTLSGEDGAVEPLFNHAYRHLTADAQRLYRDLGALPVLGVADDLLAAVGWPDRAVRRAAVDQLLGMNLLERPDRHGFRQHPLIRAHAARLARDQAPGRAERVVADAIDYFCELAGFADEAVMGFRRRRAAEPGRRANPFTGPDARARALQTLEHSREDLLRIARTASAAGAYRQVARLAEGATALYLNHRHLADWIEMSQLAVAAARRLDRPDIEAQFRCVLSRAYADAGDLGKARDEIETAVALEPRANDAILGGTVWEFYGRYLDLAARAAPAAEQAAARARAEDAFRQAIDRYAQAAARAAADGRPDDRRHAERGVALGRLFLGAFLDAAGRPADALPHLRAARDGLTAADDDRNSTRADAAIGAARLHLGQNREAYEELSAAVAYFASARLWHYEAAVREDLALAATALGDRSAAAEHAQRAADIRRLSAAGQ